MQIRKWEYLRVRVCEGKVDVIVGSTASTAIVKGMKEEDFLAAAGEGGWEAYGVVSWDSDFRRQYFFKRPVIQEGVVLA